VPANDGGPERCLARNVSEREALDNPQRIDVRDRTALAVLAPLEKLGPDVHELLR
jgi:hypothetical protein